ncbi:MAG TPA: sigma-70 family RNA polymerase sigma factor [Alphaproteobacteria bacterium]|nr:sigma-70 family RNA polymerase sigma factor [Alphaproteobacteria bacterium]
MAIRIPSPSTSTSGFSRYEDATDEQLLALMRLGDDRALEQLVGRYRGLIWRVVKTYLGTLNEAEDILQDITLSLHQNKDAYREGSAKFSSWLYRVTVNRCLDILKASRSKASHIEILETIPDALPSAEEEMEKSQLAAKMSELLALLPAQQQRVLSLYYYEGYEVTEIGTSLLLSETAVRALMKRGKEKLRQLHMAYFL